MKVYDAKNIKYHDRLAEKRQRIFILKTLFFIGLTIVTAGLVLYLFFFSGFLDIKNISISGLDKVNQDDFAEKLNNRITLKKFGYIEHQKNILFFNSDAFRAEVLASFPEIKEISVNKELPHALAVNVTERTTAGIWCFVGGGSALLTTSCKYFDKEGNAWGEAAQSSGFLILSVEDLRPDRQGIIDKNILDNFLFISEYLKEMNIFVNKFIIPKDFFGYFKAITSPGYELLLSTDSNMKEQLEVFRIFLGEKQKESGFNPQYIDLRIDGRVYYK